MTKHTDYNTENYPTFVCHHGNWNIYQNEAGYCAAIPTPEAAANGCQATHFGDAAYVFVTLGVNVTRPTIHNRTLEAIAYDYEDMTSNWRNPYAFDHIADFYHHVARLP